jgi:hypothetical protein
MTEEEKLLLSVQGKRDAKKVGKILGIAWRTVYQRRRDLLTRMKIEALEGKKEEEGFLENAVRVEKEIQKLYQRDIQIQSEVQFIPKEKHGWIGILFSGDWHLEGLRTNIQGLYDMIDRLANSWRLYSVFMGDGGDFFCGNLAFGQYDTAFSPKLARRIFWEFTKKIQSKLIAMVSGDHEWFAEVSADYNIISEITRQLSLKYLGPGGDIILRANGFDYKIHARHRYRFNSSYNLYHTNRQYLRFADSSPDIVAIAHNHVNGVSKEEFQDRQRVLIRTGTFKIADRYMQKKAYRPQKFVDRIPVVLLNLDHKEMRIADTLQEAQDLLEFLNNHNADAVDFSHYSPSR